MKLIEKGCQVFEDRTERTEARCYQSSNADIFEIHNALNTQDKGFSGIISIVLDVRNPKNNWEENGFKMKSYEVYQGTSYEINKLEGQGLIPELQCKNPCEYCTKYGTLRKQSVTDGSGFINVDRYAKRHCTQCWRERPEKYLMKVSDWNPSTETGDSQCKTECNPGFTSNGDKDKHICVACNERCLTC